MKSIFQSAFLILLISTINIYPQYRNPAGISSYKLRKIFVRHRLWGIDSLLTNHNKTNLSKAYSNGLLLSNKTEQIWDTTKNIWLSTGIESYTYGTNNKCIEVLAQYKTSSDNWVNLNKHSFSYDTNNNVTVDLYQTWNGVNWANNEMHSYTYDASFNLLEDLHQIWDVTYWIDDYRILFAYDTDNNITADSMQLWNGSNWVNSSKNSYTYSGNNKLTVMLRQDWNSYWQDVLIDSITYDNNKNLIEEFIWWDSSNSKWIPTLKNSYSYDSNNNRIAFLAQGRTGVDWSNLQRNLYTYDNYNNMVEDLFQFWDDTIFVNGYRALYSYIPTSIGKQIGLIYLTFVLNQNYPNPFNPSTIISYSIPSEGKVTIKIYNVLGQEIKTLINRTETAGNHQIIFNAGNLSSGIYLYRIQAGDYTQTKKMILLK